MVKDLQRFKPFQHKASRKHKLHDQLLEQLSSLAIPSSASVAIPSPISSLKKYTLEDGCVVETSREYASSTSPPPGPLIDKDK